MFLNVCMSSNCEFLAFRPGYDDCSAEVAVDIETGARHLTDLLYCKNYTDTLQRQPDGVEHYCHHDDSGHRYAG